jgi:hypothetical protein
MADSVGQLAQGRYWIDLIGNERIGQFGAGVKGLNAAHPGLVKIISATRHRANEAREYAEATQPGQEQDLTGLLVELWEGIAGEIPDTPERDWVLFETSAPAVWDFSVMGTPTPAGPEIKSEADTVQRPDPEKEITDLLPTTGDIGKAAGSVVQAAFFLTLLGIGTALYVMARRR